MSLSKMLLLPPETYQKLKNDINDEAIQSQLDKEMQQILKNRKLNDITKWYLYRQKLNKFAVLHRNKLKQDFTPDIDTKNDDDVEDDDDDEVSASNFHHVNYYKNPIKKRRSKLLPVKNRRSTLLPIKKRRSSIANGKRKSNFPIPDIEENNNSDEYHESDQELNYSLYGNQNPEYLKNHYRIAGDENEWFSLSDGEQSQPNIETSIQPISLQEIDQRPHSSPHDNFKTPTMNKNKLPMDFGSRIDRMKFSPSEIQTAPTRRLNKSLTKVSLNDTIPNINITQQRRSKAPKQRRLIEILMNSANTKTPDRNTIKQKLPSTPKRKRLSGISSSPISKRTRSRLVDIFKWKKL